MASRCCCARCACQCPYVLLGAFLNSCHPPCAHVQVVTLLNELFGMFDELTQRNGVYKVETIGDALM